MKTIKFRAWHKETKEMQFVRSLTYSKTGQLWLKLGNWDDEVLAKDCELMQFIGLKDKNGLEIYEGDYLKQEGLEVEVKWNEFDSGFEFVDDSGSQIVITKGTSNQWQIIGNKWKS